MAKAKTKARKPAKTGKKKAAKKKAAKTAKRAKLHKSAKTAKRARAAKSAKATKRAGAAKPKQRSKRAPSASPKSKSAQPEAAAPSPSALESYKPLKAPKHPQPGLEAASPFEMRVNLAKDLPETDVQSALDSGDMGFLHSFTTGSTVDGPGVRVVAWTTGCQWRCRYCHNPDTWTMRNGYPVSVANATAELSKYSQGLKVMSGGLTISGGEPLMQHRFVVKLFDAAKKMGVHTTIETNGFLGERLSDDDLAKIDLVMLGVKAWGGELHKELTGRDNGPTLEFGRRLAKLKRKIWVRFVLVPNLTDDLGDIGNIAEYAAGLGNVERVEVLPFHQMGRFKWRQLRIPYHLEKTEPPSSALVDKAIGIFRGAGLEAH
jgi:pyruvate formate lyase activating enzyme